jgi:HEAT repeat protein
MTSRKILAFVLVLSGVLVVGLLGAEMPTAEEETEKLLLADAEKSLKDARIDLDGAALVKYFRDRTITETDRAKLAGMVRQLGDESFDVREKASSDLVRAGRAAVPLLKEAVKDSDLEIARRAERCLEEIANNPDLHLAPAAARVLAAKKPDGALQALLDYLPWADDESVEEAVLEALVRVGLKNGKPDAILLKAIDDKHVLRRAAAAHVVGQASADLSKPAAKLLNDADARVRYRAAAALVRSANKAAVPALIKLIGEGPFPLACQSEDLLYRVAGDQSPAIALAVDDDTRRKARVAWDDWWKTKGDKVDLTKVKLDEVMQGLTLVCNCDNKGATSGRVWEFRNDKTRWEINKDINCPSDAQALPGGRVLIAEYQGLRVSERDRNGKILWERKFDRFATTCQRLANGNTFVATYGEVAEVTPKNTVVYSHKTTPAWGEIYRAQKLRNGHILFLCSQNKVIEIDVTGKSIREIKITGPASPYGGVELLANGHYLINLYGGNKVIEVDSDGKVHWEVNVQSPSSAQRLPNGHTLVSSMDAQKVVEFDRDKKEVWSQKTEGRPFRVRRY